MELVGALCGHCAGRTQRSLQKEKNSNNNEQSACNGKEIIVIACSDGKKTGADPENSERSGWQTCPLSSYIDTFYFSKNFYKNNTKLSKKKGWLRPPRPTPKLNNSLLKIGDSKKLDNVPITGSGRTVFRKKQL